MNRKQDPMGVPEAFAAVCILAVGFAVLTFILQHLAIIAAVLLPIVIFTLGAYLICQAMESQPRGRWR